MSPVVISSANCRVASIQAPCYTTSGKFLRCPCASVIGGAFLIKGRRFCQIEAVGHRAIAVHSRSIDTLSVVVIASAHRRAGSSRADQPADCGIFIAAIHLSCGHAVLYLAGLQLIHKPACTAVDSHILDGAAIHHTKQIAVQAGYFMVIIDRAHSSHARKCTLKRISPCADGCPGHILQVNVPRQRNGLVARESLCAIVYQRCQIRQFLGTADGILAACCNARVPSRDEIRLRTVVKGHITLIGQGVFQRGSILRQCRGLILALGHQHVIQCRFDVDRLTGVVRRGQLQRDRFGIRADGVGGVQLFGRAVFFNTYDDLDLVCSVGAVLFHSYRALGNHGGVSAFPLLSVGFTGRLAGCVLAVALVRVLVLVTGIGGLLLVLTIPGVLHVILALGVPAGVDISRVRVALDDGRAAAVHHLRGKGRRGHQRQHEHHAHQQAHDTPGHIACPFLHVICSSLC